MRHANRGCASSSTYSQDSGLPKSCNTHTTDFGKRNNKHVEKPAPTVGHMCFQPRAVAPWHFGPPQDHCSVSCVGMHPCCDVVALTSPVAGREEGLGRIDVRSRGKRACHIRGPADEKWQAWSAAPAQPERGPCQGPRSNPQTRAGRRRGRQRGWTLTPLWRGGKCGAIPATLLEDHCARWPLCSFMNVDSSTLPQDTFLHDKLAPHPQSAQGVR